MKDTLQFNAEKSKELIFRGSGASALKEDLDRAIRTGRLVKGSRLAPIRQIAKEYDISFGTARSAIDSLEEIGLVEKIPGSGTYVRFEEKALDNLAYLFLRGKDHIYDNLVDDLLGLLHQKSINAVKCSCYDGREKSLSDFYGPLFSRWAEMTPKYIVTQIGEEPSSDFDELICKHSSENTRIIATFRCVEDLPQGWHSVNPDQSAAVGIAVDHLVSKGHKKIGLIIPARMHLAHETPKIKKRDSGSLKWISAAENILEKYGLKNALSIHYNHPSEPRGCDPWSELNLDRVRRWAGEPDFPTAFVGEDTRIAALVRGAESMGKKRGRDFDVIGIGNTPWSITGNFSSIWLREDLIAKHIYELIEMDEDKIGGVARHIVIPPKLLLRPLVTF